MTIVHDGVMISLNTSSQEIFFMDQNNAVKANTNIPSISELLRDVGQLENKLFVLTSNYYYQDHGSYDGFFERTSSISPPTSLSINETIRKKSIDSFVRPKTSILGFEYRSSLLKYPQQVKSKSSGTKISDTATTTSGIYARKLRGGSSSSVSPQKDPFRTPPHSITSRLPRSAPSPPRLGALTRENVSLLQSVPSRRRGGGSVCGSQKSRTSVRSDGGAVFSRLYQSDYHQNRDARLRAMKERQENLKESTRIQRKSSYKKNSTTGGDSSWDSESVSSMQSNFSNFSSKTDFSHVSSRLYDPNYIRKRQERLNRMKNEREMRNCTFKPSINATSRRVATQKNVHNT
jgi:hypothetical protein